MWIVRPLDVFRQLPTRVEEGAEAVAFQQVAFNGCEEAPVQRAVNAVADRSAIYTSSRFLTAQSKGERGIVRCLGGMMYHVFGKTREFWSRPIWTSTAHVHCRGRRREPFRPACVNFPPFSGHSFRAIFARAIPPSGGRRSVSICDTWRTVEQVSDLPGCPASATSGRLWRGDPVVCDRDRPASLLRVLHRSPTLALSHRYAT